VCLIITRFCNYLLNFSHRLSGMKHILHTCSTAIPEVSLRHRISCSAPNNLLKVRHHPWGFSANMYVQVVRFPVIDRPTSKHGQGVQRRMYVQVLLCCPPDKKNIEN